MALTTYEVVWVGSTSPFGNQTHRDRVYSGSVRGALGYIVRQNPDTFVHLVDCFIETANRYPFSSGASRTH